MEILNKEKYVAMQKDIYSLFALLPIKEEAIDYSLPKFGEIWICEVPVLVVENEEISFVKMKRPILVIDDGKEHFIQKDLKNYYGLKITSQEDPYQRKKIANYRAVGLQKPSFIRLEIPMKLEKEQFCYYIGTYGKRQTQELLKEIRKNIHVSLGKE